MATSAYYHNLNKRFDDRASILRGLGFKYQHVTVTLEGAEGHTTVAVFGLARRGLKPYVVQASAVMHANTAGWLDILEGATRAAR